MYADVVPFLAAYPFVGALLAFLFGALFGSFGNVLVLRLPEGKGIGGRSQCPHCKKTLAAEELIPIVSFLMLRGRCSGCGKPISWQYPFVEALAGLLFVYALLHEQYFFLQAVVLAFSLWLLLLLAVMDARTGRIADALTVPLLVLSLVYAFLSPPFPIFAPLIGAGFFAVQWAASRGKWIGSGDVLIGAAMGFLLLDWRLLLVALFFSYVIGACAAVGLIVTKRKTRKDHLPFVPFLAAGTVLALLIGYKILMLY